MFKQLFHQYNFEAFFNVYVIHRLSGVKVTRNCHPKINSVNVSMATTKNI